MKRHERIRSDRDFATASKFGRTVRGDCLFLSFVALPQLHHRFGIIVSKRVGKAVERNYIKRQLRAILDAISSDIRPGYDIVVIVRPDAKRCTFQQLTEQMLQLLRRARLWLPPSVES